MSNPYETPNVQIHQPQDTQETVLAGRGARLGAAIIDGIIGTLISLPIMYWFGMFEYIKNGQEPPLTLTLITAPLGLLAFVLVHGYLLKTAGQTVGKRLVGIQIQGLDGQLLPLPALIGKRYVPIVAASLVPFVGQLLTLIDILFIFGEQRRCVHDLIAGTRVVDVRRVAGVQQGA